jgi:hypothetical protein
MYLQKKYQGKILSAMRTLKSGPLSSFQSRANSIWKEKIPFNISRLSSVVREKK